LTVIIADPLVTGAPPLAVPKAVRDYLIFDQPQQLSLARRVPLRNVERREMIVRLPIIILIPKCRKIKHSPSLYKSCQVKSRTY
jgi:hypothetical protein